jgi:hypothetical protein
MKRPSAFLAVAAAALLASCGDSPSSPREPATLTVNGTLPADAAAGTSVSPSVIVRDAAGRPVAGVVVTFTVTAGGGSVSSSTATTNASGIATLSWTLGGQPGLNTVVASVGSLPPVSISVTTCAAYCIAIRYVGTVSAAQEAAFTNARLRWQQVITGNLPSVQLNIPANACKDPDGNTLVATPALNEVVDDLLVYVQIDSIDGPGRVLGSAGPCFIRGTSRLPVFGIMRFDNADLTLMNQQGLLGDVILHELGHVLGFPTVWRETQYNLLQGAGTNDPYFSGSNASSRFTLAGGTLVNGGVPVENTGSEGTRDSHWREAVLGNELMTGFVSAGTNPLSAVTIGSFQDIGYQVNYAAANPYTVPQPGAIAGWNTLRLEMLERPVAAPRVIY